MNQKTLWTLCVWVSASVCLGAEPAPVAPAAAPKAAEPAPKAAVEQPDPRFKGVSKPFVEILREIEKENPKLISTWVEVRELQAEAIRLNAVFGVRARKEAERSLAATQATLSKALAEFTKHYDKLRASLVEQEQVVKDKAFRLSQRPPAPSAAKQLSVNAELDALYKQSGVLGEQIRAVSELHNMVSVLKLPDRMEQVGIGPHDSVVRKNVAVYAEIMEAILRVKDCLADIDAIEVRAAEAGAPPVDARVLAVAQRNLDAAVVDLKEAAVKVKKPSATEKAKLERSLEAANRKIEVARKSNRSSERVDTEAYELTQQIKAMDAAMENIDKLANWESLKKTGKAPAKPAVPPAKPAGAPAAAPAVVPGPAATAVPAAAPAEAPPGAPIAPAAPKVPDAK